MSVCVLCRSESQSCFQFYNRSQPHAGAADKKKKNEKNKQNKNTHVHTQTRHMHPRSGCWQITPNPTHFFFLYLFYFFFFNIKMLSYSWKMKTKPVNQKYSLVKKTDGDVLGSSVFFFSFPCPSFGFYCQRRMRLIVIIKNRSLILRRFGATTIES